MFACLAVDLGATSGRVSYGTVHRDVLSMTEVLRFPNVPQVLDGNLYWDSAGLFQRSMRGLSRALSEIVSAGYEPRSIGVDSWGVDYGIVDPESQRAVTTRHYRSAPDESVDRLRESISAEEAYSITGIAPMPINSLYQLIDSVRRGEVSAGSTALLIPDLWVYWLTGIIGAERSIASTTELLDAAAGAWSLEMIERAGIPCSALPPLFDTGTLVGEVTPHRLVDLGYQRPLSVTRVAEHDTASAVLAMPIDRPFAFVSCGSWALVGQELKSPVLSDDARCAGFTNEQGAYGTTLFMRNLAGLWILEECLREWNQRLSAPLTVADALAWAKTSEPFRSFIDVGNPDFLRAGDLTQRIERHCTVSGQPAPSTPGEFTRCLIESLALAYRLTIEESELLSGVQAEVVHIIGGGARNELLCQLTADACGRPVVAGPAEATSSGNVLVQLISAGLIENTDHARAVIAASTTPQRYLPNPVRQTDWRSASERVGQLLTFRKGAFNES